MYYRLKPLFEKLVLLNVRVSTSVLIEIYSSISTHDLILVKIF